MNYHVLHFLCLLLVLFSCFSCNRINKNANKIFAQVENIIEEHPDSALTLLKSIQFPEDLSKANYADYLLLYVQAKDKSGISIVGDSIINVSADYFSNLYKPDNDKAAWAYFYLGRVFYQQKEFKEAAHYILIAKNYAEIKPNYDLLGLIYYDLGTLYDRQMKNTLALSNYKQSHDCFLKAGNEKNANYVLGFIGDMFLQQNPQQIDSTFFYYDKAIRYAESHHDTVQIVYGLRNKAIVYREIEDYVEAKNFLLEALIIDKHDKYAADNYIVLSKIYLLLNLPDSAMYYTEKLRSNIEKNNSYAKLRNYYDLKSKIYASMFDYKQALESAVKSTEYLAKFYDNTIDQSTLDIQEKYRVQQLKNELQRQELDNQFLVIIILSVIIIAILSIVALIVKMNKGRKKIRQIEQNLEVMNEMLGEYGEAKTSLKQVFLEQLDLAKKIVQMNSMPSRKTGNNLKENYFEIFGKNIGDKLEWDNLYPVIDNLYNGFAKKIRQNFPELPEKEIQLCCLFRAGFNIDEITTIQGYDNLYSTHAQKNKLRKKLGFTGTKEFLDFLNDF